MENWHLNRSVPLSLLLMVIVTFYTATKSITEVELKTIENEADVAKNDARLSALEKSVQGQQVSLARIDENIRHIRETVDRVLNKQ
jgi:ribosomal protein L12E/L44/L45/RPP1/RPP2